MQQSISKFSPWFTDISLDDLQNRNTADQLAVMMKDDLIEKMTIHRCPWLESDDMEMDDYVPIRITSETTTQNTTEKTEVMDCKELFEENAEIREEGKKRRRRERKTVLLKGDPGIGKSTYISRLAYDWAVGRFKLFSLVFFISLKIVNPGDPIENIIVSDNIYPSLADRKYNPKHIKDILQNKGNECLLILDGFDEMVKNPNILKIVTGKQYRNCNLIVTTRPHEAEKVERFFTKIAIVEGFTEEVAKRYIKNLLKDKKQSTSVLRFTKNNRSIGIHEMWRYPVLLLFICIIVEDGELNLNDINVTLTEIYSKLHVCLYRRYIVKREKEFNFDALKKTLIRLGRLAWEGLQKGRSLYRRSEIEKEVGNDAFHYGFIIGYKDRRILRDLTSDIYVCFLHRTVQEYLAAYYIAYELNNSDRRIEDLWPFSAWDKETSSGATTHLLFVFLVDMVMQDDYRAARENLLVSCVKTLNEPEISLKGRFMGINQVSFFTSVLKNCHRLLDLTFESTTLIDGSNAIVDLIRCLPSSVGILCFSNCNMINVVKGAKVCKPDMTAFRRSLTFQVNCIECALPAETLKFLITECHCIHKLVIVINKLQRRRDQDVLTEFYKSWLSLLSSPLPSLESLVVNGDEYDTVYDDIQMVHDRIASNIIGGNITTAHHGNLLNIRELVIFCSTFPQTLLELLVQSIGDRTNLEEMHFQGQWNDARRAFFGMSILLAKQSPLLHTFVSNMLRQETFEEFWKTDGELQDWIRHHHKTSNMLDYFRYMYIDPSCFQGFLPKIKKMNMSVEPPMTNMMINCIMHSIHGSDSLKELIVTNHWLSIFMLVLKGRGLPALERLEIMYMFDVNFQNVDAEENSRSCTLPRLKKLNFRHLKFRCKVNQCILKQFLISVRGSSNLVQVNISGQNLGGCLYCLVYPEGLPSLVEIQASACDLQPYDLYILGESAKEGKLNQVERLFLDDNPDLKTCIGHLCRGLWPSLRMISLGGIQISDEDAKKLLESSKSTMPCLRRILCDQNGKDIILTQNQTLKTDYLPVKLKTLEEKRAELREFGEGELSEIELVRKTESDNITLGLNESVIQEQGYHTVYFNTNP